MESKVFPENFTFTSLSLSLHFTFTFNFTFTLRFIKKISPTRKSGWNEKWNGKHVKYSFWILVKPLSRLFCVILRRCLYSYKRIWIFSIISKSKGANQQNQKFRSDSIHQFSRLKLEALALRYPHDAKAATLNVYDDVHYIAAITRAFFITRHVNIWLGVRLQFEFRVYFHCDKYVFVQIRKIKSQSKREFVDKLLCSVI